MSKSYISDITEVTNNVNTGRNITKRGGKTMGILSADELDKNSIMNMERMKRNNDDNNKPRGKLNAQIYEGAKFILYALPTVSEVKKENEKARQQGKDTAAFVAEDTPIYVRETELKKEYNRHATHNVSHNEFEEIEWYDGSDSNKSYKSQESQKSQIIGSQKSDDETEMIYNTVTDTVTDIKDISEKWSNYKCNYISKKQQYATRYTDSNGCYSYQLSITPEKRMLLDKKYRMLFSELKKAIIFYRLDLILKDLDKDNYDDLVRITIDIARRVKDGRVVITEPDGIVIIDTYKNNSWRKYQKGSLGINHNTRVAIMNAQKDPSGVGYERKLSHTTNRYEKYVAIRLGDYLESYGTIRLSMG